MIGSQYMSDKQKHLEFIQGVVNRLANNSSLLKGWSVLLVSALFAMAAKDSNTNFVVLSYFPAIAFWILDAYFLHQERLFRKLYDQVRIKGESEIDYSMDLSGIILTAESWWDVFKSKTLSLFHGVILFSILMVTFLFLVK